MDRSPARRLLYLVHGAASYYQEAAYSLLSLWRHPDTASIEIVVVTGLACVGTFVSPPEASSFCVDRVMIAMPGTPIAYTPIDCVFVLGVIDYAGGGPVHVASGFAALA